MGADVEEAGGRVAGAVGADAADRGIGATPGLFKVAVAGNFRLKCIHREGFVSQGFDRSFDQGSCDDGHPPSLPRFLGEELQANVCQKSRQNFDQEVRCGNGELSASSRPDVDSGQLWPGRACEAVFGETRGGARTPAYPVRSPATSLRLRGKLGD